LTNTCPNGWPSRAASVEADSFIAESLSQRSEHAALDRLRIEHVEKLGVVFERWDGRDPHGGRVFRWAGLPSSAGVRHVQEQLEFGIIAEARSGRCACAGDCGLRSLWTASRMVMIAVHDHAVAGLAGSGSAMRRCRPPTVIGNVDDAPALLIRAVSPYLGIPSMTTSATSRSVAPTIRRHGLPPPAKNNRDVGERALDEPANRAIGRFSSRLARAA
jgi:hypothetical protein